MKEKRSARIALRRNGRMSFTRPAAGGESCGNVEHVCNAVLEAAENECGDRRVYGENFAGNVGCAHAHPDSYADHNVTQDAAEKDLGKA